MQDAAPNVTTPALMRRKSEMSMGTVMIGLLLMLLIIWAIWRIRKKAKTGGGCCGDHEEAIRRIKVKDRNKSHYPYDCVLLIGGMTCDNCASRVENALNELPGVWARVDIADRRAFLRLKAKPDETQLRRVVTAAGYTVLGISERSDPKEGR